MTDDEIKAIRTIYDRGYTVTAANDIPNLIDEIVRLRAENTRLRAAAEEVLSWNTGDTSTLLSNPPQNAGLFHAQRVLRAALEKKP